MKRREVLRVLDLPWAAWLPALLPLTISFLAGTIAGCLLAGGVARAENGALAAYIEGYLSAARGGALTVPSALSILWDTLRWPLLTWVMAFTALGLIGIPLLFAARGFLLAFAVASFVRVLGGAGSILAFLLFGLTGLFTIPVLFVLGAQGLAACRVLGGRLLGGKRRPAAPYNRAYFFRCGICLAVLLLCVCLEQTMLPALLSAVAGTF